jgi:Ni,Fe-hydrogenase I large subunit
MPEVGQLASVIAENNVEYQAWHDEQHKLINYLLKELDDAVRGEYKKAPATKAQRLRKVREEKKYRKNMEEFFAELMLKAAQRKDNAVS